MNHNPLNHELDDELLSAYLDDELSVEERAAVERRLAEDQAARHLLDELRHVSNTVRALPHQPLGRDLRDAVLRRVEDTNRTSAGASAAPASADATIPTFSLGRSRRGWFWASLAVAAGLVIMLLQPNDQHDDELPPVARHDGEPAVLSLPPGAAQPDAAPAESSLVTAPPEAGRDALTARGGAAAIREDPAMASAPPADRFAIALDDRPAGELFFEPTLVVHVFAKREAIEQRAFEQLLLSNGIVVESETPAGLMAPRAAPARSLSTAEQPPEEPTEEMEASAHNANIDALLVEAPRNVILSCLTDLKQDDNNFLGVSVEDPAEDASATPAAQQKQMLADDLNQFNRGIIPQQQKVLLNRDKGYYAAQAPESKPQPSLQGGAGGHTVLSRQRATAQAADETASRRQEQRYSLGRAKRVKFPEAGVAKPRVPSETLRAPVANHDTATDQLQVLFVLGANSQATAPAASAPTATPAQQPE
jgi:hypothetical protein